MSISEQNTASVDCKCRFRMAADPEAVGKASRCRDASLCDTDFLACMQAFIAYYYQLFESNRTALGTLYQDQSMLTFEVRSF